MAREAWVIFAAEEGGGWSAARTGAGAAPTHVEAADAVALAAAMRGRAAGDVLLAIPATWCLVATVETAGVPKGDRRALAYRLEERLPLAAEDVVCDFIPLGEGRALGVAGRLDRLRPAVEALESAGIRIASVVPAALLAAQAMAAEPSPHLLLVGEGRWVNIVGASAAEPWAWLIAAAGDAADVRRSIGLALAGRDGDHRVLAAGVDSQDLPSREGSDVQQASAASDDLSARAAAARPAGRRRPWVELRRDALAPGDRLRGSRRALDLALASAAIFLLALTAALWARGSRFDAEAAGQAQRTAAAFQARFPGWEVPADVRAVVASEHRKRFGGSGAGALPPEAAASALPAVRDVLGRLPGDGVARYRLDLIHLTADSFELHGQAKSSADAQALETAAREAWLRLALPELRKGDDGLWTFTLKGTWPAAASATAAQGGPLP